MKTVHIGYAYPTSPQAERGKGAGYYVTPSTSRTDILSGPHARLQDALDAVESMGCTPDRWSATEPVLTAKTEGGVR